MTSKRLIILSIVFVVVSGLFFSYNFVNAATPDQISNLTLWLNAGSGATTDGSTPAVDGDLVRQWNDASGLGHNATQTTPGKIPTYKTNIINGQPVLRFAGAHNMVTNSFLNSSYNTSFTFFSVSTKLNTNLQVTSSYGGAVWYSGFNRNSIFNTAGLSPVQFTVSPLGTSTILDKTVSVFRYNGSQATSRLNTNATTTPKTGNLNLNGALTVGSLSTNAFFYEGDIAEMMLYNRALSDSEISQMESYLMTKYAISRLTVGTSSPLIVFDGDSITYGTNSTGGLTYPYDVQQSLGINATYQNLGIPSDTLSLMFDEAYTQIDPEFDSSRSNNIVVIFGGTNDIAISLLDATTTYNKLVSYAQARRSAGYKVIVTTMLPRSNAGIPGTFESNRQIYNANVRNNWRTFADGISDVASDSRIGDAGDELDVSYYSGDKVHPGNAGYAVISSYATAAIKQILNPMVVSNTNYTAGTSTANITFDTNQLGSTKLYYGLNTNYASNTSEIDTSTRVLSHTQTISNLVSCSVYHAISSTADLNGIQATSSDFIFKTGGCVGDSAIENYNSARLASTTGGTVSLIEGGLGLSLTAPSSFGSSDADFQIKRLNKNQFVGAVSNPSGYSSVGNLIYDLKALVNNSATTTTFSNPISIVITYDDADISVLNESTLAIQRWDGSSWTKLTGCVVNADANTVTCTTDHFSVFGLYGEPALSAASIISGATASSGYIYGCGDSQALNYSKFVRHDPAYCKYDKSKSTSLFVRTLKIGMKGEDVKNLQNILISKNLGVQARKLLKTGATGYYGLATQRAVIEFQKFFKIKPALGIFGPTTRKYIDK